MKPKYTAPKIISFTIQNAACLILAYFAVNGNIGAERVFIFLVWLGLFTAVVSSFSDDLKQKARKRGRSVPYQISCSVDMALALTLIYYGWWATGIALMLTTAISLDVFGDLDDAG